MSTLTAAPCAAENRVLLYAQRLQLEQQKTEQLNLLAEIIHQFAQPVGGKPASSAIDELYPDLSSPFQRWFAEIGIGSESYCLVGFRPVLDRLSDDAPNPFNCHVDSLDVVCVAIVDESGDEQLDHTFPRGCKVAAKIAAAVESMLDSSMRNRLIVETSW